MKKFRMMAGLLAAALCLSCCPSGYGQAQTVLHIVTESTYRGGLNYVLQDAVNAFSQSHTGVALGKGIHCILKDIIEPSPVGGFGDNVKHCLCLTVAGGAAGKAQGSGKQTCHHTKFFHWKLLS